MKSNTVTFKNLFVSIVSMLYIILFTYAATSKLLDFEDFQIQLGQSPLLSAFAGIVAVGVPLLELIIVIMLCWPKWRTIGLYFSYVLMIMFTAYIFIILNYSEFIPCSCGGVLQKLGWQEHMVFNIAFAVLALVAIVVSENHWLSNMWRLKFALVMLGSTGIAIVNVASLHLLSDDLIHTENSFIRRFPRHPEPEYNKIDLKHNSYYIAGISGDKIYLGNSSTAQVVTIVDTTFRNKSQVTIRLNKPDFLFLAPHVAVSGSKFSLYDGLAPAIFTGNTLDWKADFVDDTFSRATAMVAVDTLGFWLRSASLKKHNNTLQFYRLDKKGMSDKKFVLPAQVDGIFDTDGIMLYNAQLKKLQYVYYYRNSILTFNEKLQLEREGKTIDTVSKAKITVAYTSSGESRLASPPVQVNKNAATYKNLLFVQSDRIGRHEDDLILNYATILDIYDFTTNEYISSVYVYKIGNDKLKSFTIYDNKFYTITGKYLSVVKLSDKVLSAMH